MECRQPQQNNEIVKLIDQVCQKTGSLSLLFTSENVKLKKQFVSFSPKEPFDTEWNDGSGCMDPSDFLAHYLKAYGRSYKMLVNEELVVTIKNVVSEACTILHTKMDISVTRKNINRIIFAVCVLVIKWSEDAVPNMSGFLNCCPFAFQVHVLNEMAQRMELFVFVEVFNCKLPFFKYCILARKSNFKMNIPGPTSNNNNKQP